jgi:hypothetical protein
MKTKILNILYVIFLISLTYKFVTTLSQSYGYESWNISEFLINYQGGFVRRGLLGEGLFFLIKHFQFNLEWVIQLSCAILYGLVAFFFVKSFLKKGYTLYILPLGFFLGAFLFCIDWIRKDNLAVAFFILILLLYNKKGWHLAAKIFLINLLGISIILTHEVFAFFALPILFILFFQHFKDKGLRSSFLYSALSLLPCLIALAFAFSAHGTQETACAIWDSWKPFLPDLENKPVGYSIFSIGWDSIRTMKFHFRINFLSHIMEIWSLLGWCLVFPVIYYISTNAIAVFKKSHGVYTEKHRTILSSLLLFQLVCLSPLFTFLSMDYHRVSFYWTASSFAIFLIVPMQRLENLFPAFAYKWAGHINSFFDRFLPPSKTIMVMLMLWIGIPIGPFRLDGVVLNSMIYSIMSILTEPIIILEKLGFIDVYW